MSNLPEHARITLPRVGEIEAELAALREQERTLSQERTDLIDAEAQKIAKLQIGQEAEIPHGRGRNQTMRRYRIFKVSGSYSPVNDIAPGADAFLWIEYRCQHIKKDGTLGDDVRRLYPDDGNCKLIEAEAKKI